jgi:hypothetical protein
MMVRNVLVKIENGKGDQNSLTNYSYLLWLFEKKASDFGILRWILTRDVLSIM